MHACACVCMCVCACVCVCGNKAVSSKIGDEMPMTNAYT